MTATTDTPRTPRVTFGGLLLSETIKARGLRSTSRLLAASFVLPVVIALVTAAVERGDADGYAQSVAAALGALTGMSWIPLLTVMLFGTVVATTEYERGAVMTTFAVAPRRAGVVLAKVVLVAGSVLVTQLVAGALAYVGAALVLGDGAVAGLGETPVVRVVVGTALYGAAAATIAMCIGLLVRSSIGSVAATLGFLYVLPALLQAIPVAAVGAFARTIPGPASTPLEAPEVVPDSLSFGGALVAVLAWTVVAVALTVTVLRRRDI